MSYIIAIDMDGTLLNDEKRISEENKKAIMNAVNIGHTVVIATGRSYLSAKDMLEEEGLFLPIIANNGATFFHNNQPVWKHVLPKSNVKEILGIASQLRANIMISTIDKVYLNSNTSSSDLMYSCKEEEQYYEQQKRLYNILHKKPDIYGVFDDYRGFLLEDFETLKILVSSYYQEDLEEIDKNFSHFDDLFITKSSKDNREIMVKGASKGEAILQLRKTLGYNEKEIVTIGDHFNDKSMFDVASISIAMGNAPIEIQEICSLVTKTNKEHGVAYAIENYL